MAKKKRKPRVETGYILRNTVIEEVPKKEHLGLKDRKVKTFTTYHTVGKGKKKRKITDSYVTLYKEGDVIRRTEVFYLKSQEEVERKAKQGAKQFLKTKKTNFTSIVQYYEGKKGKTRKEKFQGKVGYGSHITKAKRLQAILKKDSKVRTANKLNRYLDEALKLENDETSLLLITKVKRKYHRKRGNK